MKPIHRTLMITGLTLVILLLFSGDLFAQGISIDLGKTEFGRYMKLVGNTGDGAITNLKIYPEYCSTNNGTSMSFAIDNDFFNKLSNTFIIVNVEYYDTLNVDIRLVYDGITNHAKQHASKITTTNSGKWKSYSFLVDDAYFGDGLPNGADLKLVCATGKMFINAVSVVPFDKYINFGDGAPPDSNDNFGITQVEKQGGDSKTIYQMVQGEMCISGRLPSQYLYCAIDDAYILAGNHPYVFLSVEYYDADPTQTMRLQYDGATAYVSTPYVGGKGWGSFRTYTFELSSANFNNRENGGADMRLQLPLAGMWINRITVGVLPKKPLPNTTNIANQSAYKAMEAPTIDGNLSEWTWLVPYALVPRISSTDQSRTDEFYRTWLLNNANVPVVETGEPKVTAPTVPGMWDVNDLSGGFSILWDSTNVYVAVTIKDNVLDVTGADWSEKDGFGFYIDVSHGYSSTQAPMAIRDDLTFQPGEHFIFLPATNSELGTWRHSTSQAGEALPASVTKKVVVTDSGYVLEASIPISILKDGYTWKPGVLGDKDNFSPLFAFMVNDADNVGKSSGRLMCGGHSEDDEFWGTLTMAPLPLVDKGMIVDLGAVNYNNLMTQVGTTSGDGVVTPVQKAGKSCVKLTNLYAYFDVQDNVISAAKPHPHLLISVEYLDSAEVAGEQFKIHYNSLTDAYKSYPTYVTVGNTSTWKTAIFEISDAKFTGAASNGADFRVRCTKNSLVINQVRVIIADLWIDIGDSTAYGMTERFPGSDGLRSPAEVGGNKCKKSDPGAGYMYFAVGDSLIFNGNHRELFLTVEYYDTTSTSSVALNYDGTTTQWSNGEGNAFILGTNQWKLHTFYLPDAYFGNRENGASDFRVNNQGSSAFFVHRVFIGSVDPLVVTGVEDKGSVPLRFDLAQNYPNPFNPSTNIQYSLPKSGPVTLKIFNLLGQEVSTLVNTTMAAGTYTVRWDASKFSTGVYIYRLTQNDKVLSQKLMLIK